MRVLPIMRIGGELDLPLAKLKDSARRLSLNKNGSAFSENCRVFYLVESFQRFPGQRAEEIIRTQVTIKTFGGADRTASS
jgi:hypothetical protein